MRGPGFWKFNNSHLESDRFKEMVRMELVHLVNEHQKREGEQKDIADLLEMSPQELQEIELNLNPHELKEQIHYRIEARIISYSIAKQKKEGMRKRKQRWR